MARGTEMSRQGAEKDTNVRGLKVEVSRGQRGLRLQCKDMQGLCAESRQMGACTRLLLTLLRHS